MSLTYVEMKDQYNSLRKTFDYIKEKREEIIKFYKEKSPKSLTYIGCGSGYCLCRSAEVSARVRMGVPSSAIAAGDMMLNFRSYGKVLDGTMIMASSRSGSTSEVLKAIENVKSVTEVPVFAITCVENSSLGEIADFVLELPWAFDKSVCQTRCVVNLYTANLLVIAYLSGNNALIQDIESAIEIGNRYMDKYEESLKEIAQSEWSYAVLLADGEVQGIAGEGAMAFTEIAQVCAQAFHFLDVRHGPMVMVDDKTLVIVHLTSRYFDYQKALISDIIKRGARVIAYSSEPLDGLGEAVIQICSGKELDSAVCGIPFIFLPQALAYYKAVQKHIDPDKPQGLQAWIKL